MIFGSPSITQAAPSRLSIVRKNGVEMPSVSPTASWNRICSKIGRVEKSNAVGAVFGAFFGLACARPPRDRASRTCLSLSTSALLLLSCTFIASLRTQCSPPPVVHP